LEDENIKDILSAFPRRRDSLIPVLQQVQDKLGYLPKEVFQQMAEYLRVSANEVFGVATFYAQFRLTPRGKNTIRVCRGTACHVRGGASVHRAVERALKVSPGETTSDMKFTFETVACLGACALAPVVVLNDKTHGGMTSEEMKKLLENTAELTP
jgi:NADH-quinone oxidoreductase E subunit